MNKENILIGFIGLVAGLVIGFMFANSVNRGSTTTSAQTPVSEMNQNANMPEGHPDITGNNPTAAQMENIPEVQQAIQKAKAEPDNYDAQLKAAGFYYQINKLEEAIQILNRAIKLKPGETDPLAMMGNIKFDSEDYDAAETWYTKALAIKPNDISIRTDLGLTYVLRKTPNYDRAIQEFNKSLELDPKHLQTLQNLTVAYTKKGDAANAKATLAKVEALDPTNKSLGKLQEEVGNIGK